MLSKCWDGPLFFLFSVLEGGAQQLRDGIAPNDLLGVVNDLLIKACCAILSFILLYDHEDFYEARLISSDVQGHSMDFHSKRK